MEATAIDSRMHSFLVLYDMHSRLYQNVIEGISDKDAQNRLNTQANHVAWIAGSLVFERYGLAKVMGADMSGAESADYSLFTDHRGIKDDVTYPSLQDYKKDWEKITPHLRKVLEGLTSKQLDGPDPYQMPGESYTLFETLAFMIDRESYCIGQIGLYRRLLGYPAMKYQ